MSRPFQKSTCLFIALVLVFSLTACSDKQRDQGMAVGSPVELFEELITRYYYGEDYLELCATDIDNNMLFKDLYILASDANYKLMSDGAAQYQEITGKTPKLGKEESIIGILAVPDDSAAQSYAFTGYAFITKHSATKAYYVTSIVLQSTLA